jgi:hemoglobin/transferrin/lactoferrin receptor protein
MLRFALLILSAPFQASDEVVSESVVTTTRSHETITRSAALVTVITAPELERTGERSLPRAIEAAAGGGVWVQETNLGGGSPIIRGLIGNQILIMVDGVRLNDAGTRLGPNQSLNNFETENVERVEIVRGPSSVLYGSDAIGGVILIWTKRAGTTGPDGAALELKGGVSTQVSSAVDGGTLTVDGILRTPEMGIYAAGTWWDFEDLETAEGTVPFTGYGGRGYFTSFEHTLGTNRDLRVTADVHKDLNVPRTDRLIAGFGQTNPSDEKFDFEVQDRRRFLAAFTDSNDYGWTERTQVRASYREYTERRERQGFGSNTYRFERDETQTVGLGTDFQKLAGEDHLLTYGLDAELDDIDSTRDDVNLTTLVKTPNDGAFAPDSRYVRSGVFVQDETSFGAFDATLGARYSYYEFSFDGFDGDPSEDGSFGALTFSGQVARQLSESTRLTSTLAQGYRAPSLEDLGTNSTFSGGTEFGNPDLDPEEALTADLALDYVHELWTAGASVFFTRIEDTIGRVLLDEGDPGTTGDETYLRENVGRVDLYGGEASLRHPLGDGGLFGAYSATLTKGRQYDDTLDPTDGVTDARRIPPLFGRAAAEYRPAAPILSADWMDLELLWADEQDELNKLDKTDPRIDPNGTPGWGVVNFDLGGGLPRGLTWNAGLHNIFDKDYRVHGSGFDGPGRAVVFGLDWHP